MNEDCCLWMGDIDPRIDESTIKNLFKLYNIHPVAIKLIKNKKTNQNTNYCFIYFKNIFEAKNTLNELNGKPIPNTSLNFKLNWANFHTSTNKTIYVGNLSPSVDDISLFNFFKSKYKSVSKANIKTINRESKKHGFVTFKKKSDYRKCLIEMNKVFFEGTNIKVKEYKKKDEDGNNKNNQNNQQNLKTLNNTNNKLDLNNTNNNYNNNEILLNTNNLKSNSFLTILNTINKLNWISNANPINIVSTGINLNNNGMSEICKNSLFNQNIFSGNYDDEKNNINFENSNGYLKYFNIEIDTNREQNNFIKSDVNNVNNINKVNTINIINNISKTNKKNDIINFDNKTSENLGHKNLKLEILEKFDETTLKIKINQSLNKMLEYYRESYLFNENRVMCKLKLYI